MSGFAPLELQILSINVLGVASSAFNWNWFKWDRQLERISNFSVSQSDELDLKDIDWLKTIIAWIVVARFIIDRFLLFAYVANIYTIVTRSRQNLLVLWMVLSFLKDIILEIIVIVVTFLLWHKGSISAPRLVEFIIEKTLGLVFSTCKWCTTLKWYVQLRKVAKFRKFIIIARRSIANIAHVPGRIGRSLDDECLGIAIIRRDKYASLLNLRRFSEELSSRANAKSLTTLVTDDTNDTNDYNSDVNDLSVAEKSMRMLNVTAEDVMDARARIQERSYWDEQEAIAETPEAIEDVVAQYPSEKDKEEVVDASRNKSVKDDLKKSVAHTLRKEDIRRYPSIKKKRAEGSDKIVSVDEKEHILTEKESDVSLIKSKNVTVDKVDHMKSMESCNIYVRPKKKRKEEEEGVAKIVQCPSFQSINTSDMGAKPCASLVRKLKAKLCSVSVNQQEKWLDRVDRRKHPCQVNTQLTPTNLSASKKERYRISKISCGCHRALRNRSKNKKHVQSIDTDSKNVEYDINGKKFQSFIPILNMQRSTVDKSAFRYSEAYRLKKQIQKWEESRERGSWGSKSLAQTARSTGYAKNAVNASDKLSIVNCRKTVQIETCDKSTLMSDSSSERHGLKHDQVRGRRSVDLRSIYMPSFRERSYAEAHETKTKALETYNNFTLGNKKETKARKRHNLLPANRKLSIEQREALELKTLRACNESELTLSEDERELEVRKKCDLSLNYGQLLRESEVSEMKVLKTYNDSTLSEDKKETERTREHNLSPSSQELIDERSTSRIRNDLTRSESKREPQTGRKRDSSKDETLSECVDDAEASASVSNRLSIDSRENTTILTHRDTNGTSDLNDRYARHAHMSLNLREITRNIEWTVHPRGIILTNKNLQFLENGRFRESQQRDIVDDNTASMLHSAFFFKPEIITRVFRRAHNQTRIDEFFSSFPTIRQEDFNTEFVCRMNNEIVVSHRDSLFDYDLERIMGSDRNNLGDSAFSSANSSRDTEGEHGPDLCIIFIDREETSSESQTTMENSTTVESQEDARSSVESIRMTGILIFDEAHNRMGNTINNNLPVRLITDLLRNFDTEMPEGSVPDVALPIEECEDVSNANVHNNPQSRELNADDINPDEKNSNECDRIFSHKNVDVDDAIYEIQRTLNSSDNCPDNVNATSYVSSLEKLDNSRNKKRLNTTINSESENNSCDNNKEFDTSVNKTEQNIFNGVFENSSKLPFSRPSSFTKSDNSRASRSCDEELQKLTQLSDSAPTLNNQREESASNSKATNYNRILQCQSVETLKLETMMQDGARGQNENRDEQANEFLAEKCFKMHSDDKLQQDDSFYFTYGRNDDPGTSVSFEDGSLMEEFLNDPMPSLNPSYS